MKYRFVMIAIAFVVLGVGCGTKLTSEYPGLADIEPTSGIGLYLDGGLAPVLYRQISAVESISGTYLHPLYAPVSDAETLRNGVVVYFPGDDVGTEAFFDVFFEGRSRSDVHQQIDAETSFWNVVFLDGMAVFVVAAADEDSWNLLLERRQFTRNLREFLQVVQGR